MSRITGQSLLDAVASFTVAAAALSVAWTAVSSRPSGQAPGSNQPASRSRVSIVDGLEISAGVNTKSNPQAKVWIVEFSDFECPYCGRFARDIYPQIQRDLIDHGVVNYAFKHFPLESIHQAALRAGEASACASEQGKFWEMHDKLFDHQKELNEASLIGYASTIGVNPETFSTCLRAGKREAILADQVEARTLGVNSTPTFLVGLVQSNGSLKIVRKLSGAQPYEVFKSLVDEVLKGA